MSPKTALAIAAPVLFLLFLIVAGLERGTHFFDFRLFQFHSSFFFVVILFVALGAFSMFVLFTMFPPRPKAGASPETARTLPPMKKQSLLRQAEMEVEMGNIAEAVRILGEIAPADPDGWRARKLLGDLAAAESRFEESEFYYQEALKASVGAERGLVLLALANLYEAQENIPMACDLYREVARLFPTASGPVFRLRSLSIAGGEWEEAIHWQSHLEEHFSEMLSGDGEDALRTGLRYEVAAAEYERGAYKNAQALVKNIFRITDNFTPAYLLAGEILEKLDNSSAAIKMWERGFEASGNPVLMQRVSEALLSEDLPEKAVEHFQLSVRENPGRSDLEYCLADLYLRLEMVHEAQQILERLHARHPDWALNSRTLADLYHRTGEFHKASDLYSGILDQEQRILPWICYMCHTTYDRYCGRCGSCQEWNTVQINHNEAGSMELNAKNTAYVY